MTQIVKLFVLLAISYQLTDWVVQLQVINLFPYLYRNETIERNVTSCIKNLGDFVNAQLKCNAHANFLVRYLLSFVFQIPILSQLMMMHSQNFTLLLKLLTIQQKIQRN